MYRDAAYFSLFVVYLATAVLFHFSLPSKSLGRVAIVTGFTIWAFVFLLHSWVTNRPQYIPVAAEVWDWQKFLVTIGMLLVMLERQVSSNEWFALHDQLTGLPNRRLFEDRLGQAIHNSQGTGTRTAVMMIDLNGFKSINDSHGHDVGDRPATADRAQSARTPSDPRTRWHDWEATSSSLLPLTCRSTCPSLRLSAKHVPYRRSLEEALYRRWPGSDC